MNIAILGFGTVGKGVYDIVTKEFDDINVKYVLDRHPEKTDGVNAILTLDFESILDDPEVDVIVELLGGKDNAYPYVKAALEHDKHVVTANKALISACYQELKELAELNKVKLLFEASTGGGIHILQPLKEMAGFNHIHKITGIINGSTNYVLSKVFREDYSLEKALQEAKELGYLETGTNDDMEGLDLMRKINILSMIAYDQYLDEKDIELIPLTSVTQEQIDIVKKQGKIVKYVASSERKDDKITIKVEPVVLDQEELYANINYEENIITLYGEYHQKQSFIGQGAGRYPTASAIVGDVSAVKKDSF